MKFDGYKLMTDFGVGLFLLLILFGKSEAEARALAQGLSSNQFLKARDMKKGSAIRPIWAKILALVRAFFPNTDHFTVIREAKLIPDSYSVHPGTYPADTPPPRNSSTAD